MRFSWARRRFLQSLIPVLFGLKGKIFSASRNEMVRAVPEEAMFYKTLDKGVVQCQLCPRQCIIPLEKRGFCRNRENQNGRLYSKVYGKPCVVDIGPIEKAPLYHFIPGHSRLCLTCASCNLRCKYCHNWHLSQKSIEELDYHSYTPFDIVKQAEKYNLKSISFTYTEPTVYYEYLYDICVIAKKRGLRTSIVSNGFIRQEPLLTLLPVLDAVKIDLKGFSEKFYEEVCSASLKPVLESLVTIKKSNTWLEIVNLVVPTLNDDPVMIEEMCRWVKENLGDDTPLHFTRFFPNYKLTHLSATPISTLESAYEIARKHGLKYVYIGNVPGHVRNSTFCPSCQRRIIHRSHFDVLEIRIAKGKCEFCNFSIPGIWA